MNRLLVVVAALLAATPAFADNPLTPFPSPMTPPSAAPTSTAGFVSGACATVNAIAFFSAASTVSCDADFVWTPTTNTLAFASDTAVSLGGGVNGINFDSNTLSIDATNNRVGFGTAAPTAVVDVVAGTLPSRRFMIGGTGTLAASAITEWGMDWQVTTNAGASASSIGIYAQLLPGFTGTTGNTYAVIGETTVAGTGTQGPWALQSAGTDNANYGFQGGAFATTTGTNVGAWGNSSGGNINIAGRFTGGGYTVGQTSKQDALNVGVTAQATVAHNGSSTTEMHIGVIGEALAGDTNVAGFFGLMASAPTLTTAALMSDNGVVASPIYVGRDNGTNVFVVNDGGLPDSRNVSATSDAGTGSCTAVTVTGNNVRGKIVATCVLAQTVVMNFGSPNWPAAPTCVFGVGGEQTASSTSATTVKAGIALTGGTITYLCWD